MEKEIKSQGGRCKGGCSTRERESRKEENNDVKEKKERTRWGR